ncbi:orange carotenoid protein [Ancylothrix sp. C2]|uniref:orange carotenoid protein N-terminal domain-containing protein n=1 Tax=Ancylothrix sp. D3o TaxID=2953691 RepID=UPI0021BB8AA9|nr:orange carotenoid protein N-terminal domain-containing protein [Ancylothrix sp. D3o]MCT7952273.1 orange carotenoid protein [Ancylothrix sp. D3o]
MQGSHSPRASHVLSSDSQEFVKNFQALNTDDKLALLYYIYEQMGDSITPAAPQAAQPEIAPILLGDFYELSDDEQLNVMRAIVNREPTEYSRAYGALSANNQLVVWYAWAQGMGDTVVDIPDNYQASEGINNILQQIEGMEFQDQISIFRQIAEGMGYTEVIQKTTLAETGVTPSL